MERRFSACIFDVDGVLIDTEPFWHSVERDVFARVGVDLSTEQLQQTWGLRVDELVAHWYRLRPWNGVRPRAVEKEIVRAMVAHVREEGTPLAGAVEAVGAARAAGLRVGLASSSAREIIDAVVDRLGIADLIDCACTADDEVRGKPDPAVYLRAARLLDTAPSRCIAVEDSPVGVSAAVAAGMRCVGVRTHGVLGGGIDHADVLIDSLLEFDRRLWGSADPDPRGQ